MRRKHLSKVQEVFHVLLLEGLVECNSIHRSPIENHGTAAITMVPIRRAKM